MYNSQLKTFITVADMGSFNKAAEVMFISSTAVIKQMNLLESHLGVTLFHRSHKGLSLTKAGSLLYKDAKYMIDYSEQALERLKEVERGGSDVVRIGVSPITPADYLPTLSDVLQASGIHFQLVPYENNPENARLILDNLGKDIDVVLGFFDENTDVVYDKIQTKSIRTLPLSILVPLSHPLNQKETLTMKDLEGESIYVLESNWAHAFERLGKDLEEQYPSIHVKYYPFINMAVFNECVQEQGLLAGFHIWENVHPFLTTKSIEWDYAMHNGILYSQTPSKAVQEFLRILEEHML